MQSYYDPYDPYGVENPTYRRNPAAYVGTGASPPYDPYGSAYCDPYGAYDPYGRQYDLYARGYDPYSVSYGDPYNDPSMARTPYSRDYGAQLPSYQLSPAELMPYEYMPLRWGSYRWQPPVWPPRNWSARSWPPRIPNDYPPPLEYLEPSARWREMQPYSEGYEVAPEWLQPPEYTPLRWSTFTRPPRSVSPRSWSPWDFPPRSVSPRSWSSWDFPPRSIPPDFPPSVEYVEPSARLREMQPYSEGYEVTPEWLQPPGYTPLRWSVYSWSPRSWSSWDFPPRSVSPRSWSSWDFPPRSVPPRSWSPTMPPDYPPPLEYVEPSARLREMQPYSEGYEIVPEWLQPPTYNPLPWRAYNRPPIFPPIRPPIWPPRVWLSTMPNDYPPPVDYVEPRTGQWEMQPYSEGYEVQPPPDYALAPYRYILRPYPRVRIPYRLLTRWPWRLPPEWRYQPSTQVNPDQLWAARM